MNFTWTDFGILDKFSYDYYGNLFVHNTENERRKMSSKYKSIFPQIEQKCQLLQGKFVQVRTSQNTDSWSTLKWFSDISLLGTNVSWTASSEEHIENSDELKEKVKKLTQERDQAKSETSEANVQLQDALDRAWEAEAGGWAETTQALERESLANDRAFLAEEKLELVKTQKEEIEITLDMLLAGGETIACEFKQTLSLDVKKIKNNKSYNPKKEQELETTALKPLIGFLNGEGGTLLIGVSDTKVALGINEELEKLHHSPDPYKSLDKFTNYFTNLITQRISKSALANYMDITMPKHKNGATVVRIEVKKSLVGPEFLKPGDHFYVRFPASTLELTGQDLIKYCKEHWPD